MAIFPTSPNQSSSSSSSQPLLPATQQQQLLHTRLESQTSTCPTLQFSISGGGSNTTTHHDQDATTSNGHDRRVATFDLNFPSSEPDVGVQVQVQDNIPQTIRLTNLKQLARANNNAEDATTSHEHGRRIATFDLNSPSTEPDIGVEDNVPHTIRLTNLKRLARANRNAEDATTSHEHGRRIATFDLNSPPTEPDVGVQVQDDIPQTIRLTNLKQLARAELENPVQKKKSTNEPEDNSAGPEENIADYSQQQLDVACQSNSSSAVRRRRNRCPGKNGRTCHQCHQKTLDFVASCKSGREETPCTKGYCVKCIWNRYGDKFEVAHPSNNWRCPSCRGICNCGRCMKEKGFQPVGIRGRVDKTGRFLSVMERLAADSSKNINEVVDHKETSATEENVPGSDGRKDAGRSNSMEVHLRSEVNPRVGVEEEKSASAGGDMKNISNVVKTISSRNDVLSVLLSPSRVDYESLLQPSDLV